MVEFDWWIIGKLNISSDVFVSSICREHVDVFFLSAMTEALLNWVRVFVFYLDFSTQISVWYLRVLI